MPISPNQFEAPLNYQENTSKPKLLSLFKIGLLEIIFVFILLFSIFGILNYFNILKISSAFPVLSFLPHPQMINRDNQNNSLAENQRILTTYLQERLKSHYLPPPRTSPTITNTELQLKWQTDNLIFTAGIRTAPPALKGRTTLIIQPDTLKDLTSLIQTPSTTTLSASLAASLTDTFFQKQKNSSEWSCSQTDERILCQQSFTTTSYVQGISVRGLISRKNVLTSLTILGCTAPFSVSVSQVRPQC